LQFHLDEKTYAALPSMDQGKDGERLSRDSFEHPGTICNLSLAAVKDGICLNSDDLGIWFIPYSDIETYLNTHPIEEPNPLTPGVAIQVRVPPPEDDAESQVIGDMIDPAIRAMSFR
jgi:hypothetical protein